MKIKLMPFESKDFDNLLSWVSSERELKQWSGPNMFSWPLNKEQLSRYLARTKSEFPEAYIFKAMQEDITIGHIELDKINRTNKTAILSRVLVAPQFRGKGLGYEMIKIVLDYAFNILKLREVK